MYHYKKIKTKNNYGYSSRTSIVYDDIWNVVFIETTMLFPNKIKNDNFKTIRKFKKFKLITNNLQFKLSTALEVTAILISLVNMISETKSFKGFDELLEYSKTIKYK